MYVFQDSICKTPESNELDHLAPLGQKDQKVPFTVSYFIYIFSTTPHENLHRWRRSGSTEEEEEKEEEEEEEEGEEETILTRIEN